ncbi:MAG: IPT/TIG domain-containing protein [Deltaproteobacteria bacterium]|nr:IPT/TIG domain-containing protein [Deltaproteobacteria bacterium]
MTSSLRSCAALLVSVLVATGCPATAPASSELPSGVPLEELSDAQRALVRVTLSIDDGVLAETDLQLAGDRLRGDVALNNVAADGEHEAILRIYGRFDDDAVEVLLGEARKAVQVTKQGASNLDFSKDDVFESCARVVTNACAVRFDVNRNGVSNLEDLLPDDVAAGGIDPGPEAPFLDVAPSSLQFPSGIEIGAFARQVLVLENTGANPVRVLRAEVVAAPGAGLALFDVSGAPVTSSRRVLEAAQFTTNLEKNAELLIAVNFAPANAFLTTGAVHVVVEDTVTGVRQTARVKLIGNPDGALRVRGADDSDAQEFAGAATGFPVFTYPLDRLLSGLPTTSDDPALDGTGLASVDPEVVFEDIVGPDVGYVVEVPPGQRLSASLGGLASDIDLHVLALSDNDAAAASACDNCRSQSAGISPEGVDVENDSADTLRLLVVLARVDIGDEPARVPFELTLLRTDAPSFVDDAPVAPVTGPLEGGTRVTLIGRGFDDSATVRIGGTPCLDVDVNTDDGSRLSTVTLTLPPGSLDPGRNPATIVVQNPAIADGGDGQAAVLPDGFLYQPPAPRVDTITPALASTGTNTAPVQISGAFFQGRFGAPRVFFDDDAVDAVFIDSTRIEAVPPSGHAVGTAFLTVQNVIDDDGSLSLISAPRPFRFLTAVGPAPVIAGLAPATGSTDGGDVVTVTGQNFALDSVCFVGGVAAPTAFTSATSLVVTLPPRIAGGRVDFVVSNADGQAALLRGGFEYVVPVPVVDEVFPTRATDAGGTLVVISGGGYRPGARVRWVAGATAVAAGSVSVVSSRTLIAASPALAPGSYSIEIENLDGSTTTFPGFTVFVPAGPGPRVLALEPPSGSTLGGTDVVLFGRDLADVTVTIGADTLAAGDVTLTQGAGGDADEVRFTTPAAAGGVAGVVVVQVINGDGQSAAAAFSYVANGASAAPRIDDVTPARISGLRPITLAITGANLTAGATVLVGGTTVASTVVSSTEISCVVPPRAAGSPTVTITNPDGTQASYAIEVTGPPVIAGLSTTSVHALVPGDQVLVIGDALDVEPIDTLIVSGPGGSEAGTVLEAANGFLVVEVPALPGAAGWEINIGYSGGTDVVSPQTFTAVEPIIDSINVTDSSGEVLLDVRGDGLNPERFDELALEAGGLVSTCVPVFATETRVVCRPTPGLVANVDYGASMVWEGTFGGDTIPVSLPAVFLGTDEPIVVRGQSLTATGVSGALPGETDLTGLTLQVTVPGAQLLPGMIVRIDGVDVGDVIDVDGDDLTCQFIGGSFGVGTHVLVIQLADGSDYTLPTSVEFAAAVADALSPSTTTWPNGFAATGGFGPADTLSAVRVDDGTIVRPLPTTVAGNTATCGSTSTLSAGTWTICASSAANAGSCAGPVLTVEGAGGEVEGIDNALEPGVITSATHDDAGDEWFFFANAGDPIVVDVSSSAPCAPGTAVAVSLRGDRQLRSSVANANCSALVAVVAPETGEYAISTSCSAPGGGYDVVVDTAPIESEPNEVTADALPLVDDAAVCSGELDTVDVDLWSFTLPAAAAVSVALDVFPSCAVPMRLKVLSGSNVVAENVGQAAGACPLASSPVLPPGSYTVSVSQAPGELTLPSYALSWERAICGDGIAAGPEACDDGRNDNGDGCSSTCGVEGQAICAGTPSKCVLDVLFADDMEDGINGWTTNGFAWGQAAANGNTSWQWALPADGDVQGVFVSDEDLLSPPIDLGLVRPGDPVFLSIRHRDDELIENATVSLEVAAATGGLTPPGPLEPIGGYSPGNAAGDAYGCCSDDSGFVEDLFDLSPWAGATGVVIGLHSIGQSFDDVQVAWRLDDVRVVGSLSGPLVPDTWSCSPSFFGTGDGCDCGCGAVDLDCAQNDLSACEFCDDTGSCSDGSGCPGLINVDDIGTCTLVP